MDIKEFIAKARLYNEDWSLEVLCEALEKCIYCNGCPLYKECHKPENKHISCVDILEKYLTIN